MTKTTNTSDLTPNTLTTAITEGFNELTVTTRHRRYTYRVIDGAWCLFGSPKKLAFICRHANSSTVRWALWG